jgi:hypothetical protein
MLPDLDDLLPLDEEELSRRDVAVTNLACAMGLPGSDAIDVPHCFAWLAAATDLVKRWTEAGLVELFRPNPAEYKNSEAYFRVLAMASALQRHCGVRYDPSKIGAGPEVPFDLHDEFIHGVVQGPGGTCASLPVVYASIGRRLGYPIRLVCTKRHLFSRWDDPKTGERFNIECAGDGFSDFPDDHYRSWPLTIESDEEERAFGYLESFSPRRELANSVASRAFVFRDHKRYWEAAEAFCIAAELTPTFATYPTCIRATMKEWHAHLESQYPPRFPRRIEVVRQPSLRRWKSIPWEVEREIGALRATEHCLNDPDARAAWWDPLRENRPTARPVPDSVTVYYDHLFPTTARS